MDYEILNTRPVERVLFQRAIRECLDEVAACNIPIREVTDFSVNRRAQHRWGQCCKKPDGKYSINISYKLMSPESYQGLKETILHELCHTAPGGHGHKGDWITYIRRLNARYGYHIKRSDTSNDKGVDAELYKKPAKYVIRCTCCGKTYERMRATKITQQVWRYHCGICQGKLEVITN